jgi:glycosyltransferase involved in cell wall biosynthesis
LAEAAVQLLGADPARTLVIPDTFDAETFAYVEREASDGAVRLISVGRLVPVKGYDLLLRAFADARPRLGPPTSLRIVGDGPDRAALGDLARTLGLTDAVRFVGALTGRALAEELAGAHAFVSSSRKEGFGVALVEGLATGLPVLATRSGGPEDFVRPEQGILVAPDDADALAVGLVDLVEGLAGFDRRAIAASVAEQFAPDIVGRRLVRLYSEVLAGGALSHTLAEGVAS